MEAPATVANAQSVGIATPPDLHESFMIGRTPDDFIDDVPGAGWPVVDDPEWFPANIWPEEVPELLAVLVEYSEHMERLGLVLMDIIARARARALGSITILDRQSARSGLQIQSLDGSWGPAPFVPGALTINTGDLLSRWTGDRWRSTKHQVPAPSADAPNEELLSLVFFYDVDPTALIETLPAPVAGPQHYKPVLAGDYLLSKINAIQTA